MVTYLMAIELYNDYSYQLMHLYVLDLTILVFSFNFG